MAKTQAKYEVLYIIDPQQGEEDFNLGGEQGVQHPAEFPSEGLDELPLLPLHYEQPVEEATPNPAPDYLLEPGRDELLRRLAPDIVHNRLYLAMLDSSLAEYAARMVAMQIATDNADDLLSDLNIQYNKQRQQKITNELLDIVGGAAALE